MWKISVDQTGKELKLETVPKRIVSVVPSQTELLFDLGLEDNVLGITKFCVHPEAWFRTKTRVGGTKTLDIARIRSLHPDLVIANKEENTREDVGAISSFCPVWTSDIHNITGALEMIRELGMITGKEAEALELVRQIEMNFTELAVPVRRAAYLIWKNPYMAAGGDTFINDMMKAAGLENVFSGINRYPEVDIEQIRLNEVEVLLLSSEPYPFKMRDLGELSDQLPDTKIVLADGEMFSWYGSRMREFPAYIKGMNW
ncbi:MAG TPA: helical backbone metal receptor [Chitinophagaceae bacterium]|nr:helical backbone metal receptor [Chitinophagaceae bacterium]